MAPELQTVALRMDEAARLLIDLEKTYGPTTAAVAARICERMFAELAVEFDKMAGRLS